MSETINSEMSSFEIPRCSCSACMQASSGALDNDNPTQDDPLYAPTVTATPEQFANYLTDGFWQDRNSIGRSWDTTSDNEITFSMSSGYDAAQKDGIRMAFESWSDVANITFREISANADIDLVTNTQNRAFSSSSVYSNGNIASNYISIDDSQSYWSNFGDMGDYALLTAIHEIGHSLGLGHTANYNGSGTYANDAQFVNDSHQYSVMSYFNASNTGSNHQGEYASTPMIYDILAVQNIYGANMNARAGDTVYGYNSTAGSDQFDFSINTAPVVAIWDGNGTDTIDVSGYGANQIVNLNDGEFSNVMGSTGNLAIAIGATIENAITGGGNDWIYGNEVNNTITLGSGNDRGYGSLGSDIIDGGTGTDTMYYEDDDLSDFSIASIDADTLTFTHNTHGYTDTVSNFEQYTIGGQTYADTYLRGLLNVDYIAATFKGEDNSWRYKMGNLVAGNIAIDSGDLGHGGSTNYVTGTRASNTTLTLQDEGNNTEVAYLSTTVLRNVTLTDFEYVETYLRNSSGVNLTVNGGQQGKLVTGVGNDTLNINATLVDGTDSLSMRIESGDGSDNINYTSANASLSALIYAGGGVDDITIIGTSSVTTYGQDGDDTISGGAGVDRIYGGLGSDDINGNSGNDVIRGEDGDDIINGNNGNDSILGGNGIDTINGGSGADTLYGDGDDDIISGGADNDRLYGGLGADDLSGGTGADRLYGGDGDDTLFGGDDADRLYGQNNNDTLHGGDAGDILYGQGGDDIINGDAGDDDLLGGTGNDTLDGGADNDTVRGEDGNDILNGGTGNDFIVGGNGLDTLNGDDGDDELYGNNDDDILNGGAGEDELRGGAGNDTLHGGDDADFLSGEDDDDILYGDGARDNIYGGNGNDILHGGADADRLYGGNGNDTLVGLGDYDAMRGQAGADTFATTVATSGYDTFSDFRLTEGDIINVTDILDTYNHGISDINDFVYFDDRGSFHDMYVSTQGDGSFNRVARVYDGNTMDGQSVDDLVALNQLVADQSVL